MQGTTNYCLHENVTKQQDTETNLIDFVENLVMLISSSFNPPPHKFTNLI